MTKKLRNIEPAWSDLFLKKKCIINKNNSSTTIQSSISEDYKIYKFGNRVIDFQALYVQQVKHSFLWQRSLMIYTLRCHRSDPGVRFPGKSMSMTSL